MNKTLKICLKALCLSACLLAARDMSAATIQVTANISGNVTWRNTNVYVLNGFIYVLEGATLTIEPGTLVKAKPGQDANTSCLIVTRGGKIFANGTRAKPIIFTAEADDPEIPDALPIFQRGLWGGVVLLGRTTINTALDTAGNAASPKYDVFEGLPDSEVGGQFVNRFGGNDDNDSSGVMRYVSIRHSGVVFQPNKELNGLSLGAVGRGTVLEHIEAYAVADDGFEFFGGTVNTKYLVSAFNDDDCFDIDQGFRGKNQFWFSIQEPGRKDSGGEWNGEPNGVAIGASPIANYEIYNATLVGAGTNTTANRGFFAREFAAPKLYNSILTDFGGNAVRIDTKSAVHLTNGILDVRDNIFWNFATSGVAVALAEVPEAQVLFSDASRSNLNVNPMLRSISRANNFRLDPRLSPGSPALDGARATPNDGFYSPAPYKGAFDTNDLWIAGWTALASKEFIRPRASRTIQVTANISGNVTWFRTNEYVLNGFIYVLDGAVLTIEAGTIVKAKPGQDANTSCLIVTTGGKIFALGSPDNPIIFTAEADDVDDPTALPLFQRGLWGGVVLLGRAVLNTTLDTAGNAASPKYEVFEGLPDTQVGGQFVNRFGGNNDNDSSGIMRYVSIRRSGIVFQPNKELNGLSLGAVGRGTTLEYIETYGVADDGYEFFGGTVNTKYLISAFNDDDCFDIDQGFRGKNQFWFSIQEPGRKDSGGEWNGEPNGVAVGASPIANYEIYNATLIGAGTNTTANRGFFAREFAAPKLYNSILTDFGGNAVRIDTKSAVHLTNGILDVRDNIFWNFATSGVAVALAEVPEAQVLFSDASRSNLNVNPMLRGISRAANTFGLDPRPSAGSPALSGARATPTDGFYCAAPYKGAFGEVNWAADWTFLGELCMLTGAGASIPYCQSTSGPVVCAAPTLLIVRNGSDVDISFATQTGCSYQVESTASLSNSITWNDEGSAIAGTGSIVTRTYQATGNKFYRVQTQ
jgi:hypothetical protein